MVDINQIRNDQMQTVINLMITFHRFGLATSHWPDWGYEGAYAGERYILDHYITMYAEKWWH